MKQYVLLLLFIIFFSLTMAQSLEDILDINVVEEQKTELVNATFKSVQFVVELKRYVFSVPLPGSCHRLEV